jgi:hypothetical protein
MSNESAEGSVRVLAWELAAHFDVETASDGAKTRGLTMSGPWAIDGYDDREH